MAAVTFRTVLITALGAILIWLAPCSPVLASPLDSLDGAIRVSGTWGWFGESSRVLPGVDVTGSVRFGEQQRGDFGLRLDYSPIDNHTYLSDGRIQGIALTGGMRLLETQELRIGGVVAAESVAYYADPDLRVDHPHVDPLLRRGGVVTMVGLELSYRLIDHVSIGLEGRISLTDLALYREDDIAPDLASGLEKRAQLFLLGVFLEYAIR